MVPPRCLPLICAGAVGAMLACSTARDVDHVTPDFCYDCHGERTNGNAAPPPVFWRDAAASDAHQQHLAESTWRAPVRCAECHRVPESVLEAGHVDSSLPAELTWGALASANGADPAFDGTTCSNAYCHGATLLAGGTNTAPQWTIVDGSQAECGTCHGLPPDLPHPARTDCHSCHSTIDEDQQIVRPDRHIDGEVDLDNLVCDACHGSDGDPAPPFDLAGNSDTAATGVGAHRQHLAASTWRGEVTCDQCHVVPTLVTDPGHRDSDLPAELTWGALASANGAAPAWDGSGCAAVYCHGTTLASGNAELVVPWTQVDGSYAECGACHAAPPTDQHPRASASTCAPCHAFTGLVPDSPSTHIDGDVDVERCGSTACHAVPPTDAAHVVHFGETASPPRAEYGDLRTVVDLEPSGAPYYLFGCGHCHPLDPADHGNGSVDVVLYDPSAPTGSLKARHPAGASFDGVRCSDVYCHSSGQASPAYATTPAWSGGAFPGERCAGCHDNPPAYPSGGAGTATANTHLILAADGTEYGHFGGLPGPWHGSRHGDPPLGSAPITCQTCHYATANPSAVGPGGFYFLDTTGDYDLGGDLAYSCGECHTGDPSDPAIGGGDVLTAAHVNGVRDVQFDPRTAIPAGVTGIPVGEDRPTYPYWLHRVPDELPPDSVVDGDTWSFHLANSAYDPATKSCTGVPCHLKQSFGGAYDPLRWGYVPVGVTTCNHCHQF